MLLVLKLLKLAFPLLKEYGDSNFRLKDSSGKKIVTVCTALTLVWLTLLVVYLSEQSTRNLNVHEPLVNQFNKVSETNIKLEEQVNALKTSVVECELAHADVYRECRSLRQTRESERHSQAPPVATGTNYQYDPNSRVMIESR